MLDEFQVVLHSSDFIAPVGILHPLKYHLEHKEESTSVTDCNTRNDAYQEEMDSVCEVQGNCLQRCEAKSQPTDVAVDAFKVKAHKLHISKTKKSNIFSISCWMEDSCKTSVGKFNYTSVAVFISLMKIVHLFFIRFMPNSPYLIFFCIYLNFQFIFFDWQIHKRI